MLNLVSSGSANTAAKEPVTVKSIFFDETHLMFRLMWFFCFVLFLAATNGIRMLGISSSQLSSINDLLNMLTTCFPMLAGYTSDTSACM